MRLPYLRTSGTTEEFTLTRPCVNLKKQVDVKVHTSNKQVLGLKFVKETYNSYQENKAVLR